MDDLIQQGASAFKAGDKEAARKLLITAVKQNPDSERAWGWMYNVCITDKERIQCLKQMLRVNPYNEKAKHLLDKLTEFDFPLDAPVSSEPTKQSNVTTQTPVSNRSKMPAVPMENVGGYIQSILMPKERVLATAKIHWVIYITPAIFTFLAIITTIASFAGISSLSSKSSPTDSTMATLLVSTWCCIPFWLMGLIGFIVAFLRYKTTEFALTDKRVIGKYGIIRRNSLELVLGKVESIRVNQDIGGRILDYGTVIVTGSGGTHQLFPYIAAPMEMKKTINAILAE